MNVNWLFTLGTLATWAGAFAAFMAMVGFAKFKFDPPAIDPGRLLRASSIQAGIAVVLLIVGPVFTNIEGVTQAGTVNLPLVWVGFPFLFWVMGLSAFMVGHAVLKWFMVAKNDDRTAIFKQGGYWLLGGILTLAWFLYTDPNWKIAYYQGGIQVSPATLLGLILALALAGLAMVWAGRSLTTRNFARATVTYLALGLGTVIFGVPFAFLVITSFKEDRDMSSPKGIVWIPKVTQTVPYLDPKNPIYEAKYKGKTVTGTILERKPNGEVQIDISEPLAIRGTTFLVKESEIKVVPRLAERMTGQWEGRQVVGIVIEDLDDGRKRLQVETPVEFKGRENIFISSDLEPVRDPGLRVRNYSDALSYLPPETNGGLVYLKNTLILVVMGLIGTVLSCSIVAYGFSRLQFPGRDFLFNVMLSTMMLPGAVTLLPSFLIFRSLGWIDTLYPLWVPAFFAGAFNVFLLRQFFKQIPMELEDAAKIDGCSFLRTFWSIMMPQITPALAVIAIGTFTGAWNNFMGPLIYISSPENMTIGYALQLFQGDRGGEPGLLMAFSTLMLLPVIAVFVFAQKYFIEGVSLSGLGGR